MVTRENTIRDLKKLMAKYSYSFNGAPSENAKAQHINGGDADPGIEDMVLHVTHGDDVTHNDGRTVVFDSRRDGETLESAGLDADTISTASVVLKCPFGLKVSVDKGSESVDHTDFLVRCTEKTTVLDVRNTVKHRTHGKRRNQVFEVEGADDIIEYDGGAHDKELLGDHPHIGDVSDAGAEGAPRKLLVHDVSHPGREMPVHNVSHPGRETPVHDVSHPGREMPVLPGCARHSTAGELVKDVVQESASVYFQFQLMLKLARAGFTAYAALAGASAIVAVVGGLGMAVPLNHFNFDQKALPLQRKLTAAVTRSLSFMVSESTAIYVYARLQLF